MTSSLFRKKFGSAMLLITFANGCSGYLRSQDQSEPQITQPTNIHSETDPAEKASAVVVHIDPKTGQIITPPSGSSPDRFPQPSSVTAKPPLPDLQQTPSPVPGGGVMIQLDERFMAPSTATIDADGKLRLGHPSSESDLEKNK